MLDAPIMFPVNLPYSSLYNVHTLYKHQGKFTGNIMVEGSSQIFIAKGDSELNDSPDAGKITLFSNKK